MRVAALLLGSALALPCSAADPPAACTRALLSELGWRIAPGEHFEVFPGRPCDRTDLAEAHAQGDLRLVLPPMPWSRELDALLHHPATHCAWSLRLGAATQRATEALVANHGLKFSSLQTGWIAFGWGGARRDGWEPTRAFGFGYRPRRTPSSAIQGLYTGTLRAECGAGRQLAQYASLYEVFGAAAFDQAFAPDEIVIGTFAGLRRTRSVLLGASAGEFAHDGMAKDASRRGRQAFSGLPGFVFHVLGRETLDDFTNQAENFVVYDVSPAAVEALRQAGGFEPYNRRARELWELSRGLDLTAQRIYERLLFERDPVLRAAISARKLRTIEQMDAVLADPFFRGFSVYVHRQGIKPIGYHFARLLDRNPRTPFRVELALHNLHTTIYERWLAQRRRACAADP